MDKYNYILIEYDSNDYLFYCVDPFPAWRINQRHYYMKDVYLFIAEPGNTRAILAASAIARAMEEMNKVAILRCVWRQGQQNVVVGVLTPNISQSDKLVGFDLFTASFT